jgi:SAM-dependent methyltransferase
MGAWSMMHESDWLGKWEFWREVWRGKSPARILMNLEIHKRVRLSGRVVDLGAGGNPSYWRFLSASGIGLIKVDFPNMGRPHVAASLEDYLPFQTDVFDVVLLFNVLEHVYASERLLSEIHRTLKPDGVLYLFVPFLVQVHPDPYDYRRFTGIALERMFADAGFSAWTVVPLGKACLSIVAAAYPLLFSPLLRIPALIGAGLGDILLERMSTRHPNWPFNLWASGYFACVSK